MTSDRMQEVAIAARAPSSASSPASSVMRPDSTSGHRPPERTVGRTSLAHFSGFDVVCLVGDGSPPRSARPKGRAPGRNRRGDDGVDPEIRWLIVGFAGGEDWVAESRPSWR